MADPKDAGFDRTLRDAERASNPPARAAAAAFAAVEEGERYSASFEAARARDARVEAERRNLLHRWHLAQLAPERSDQQPN